MLPLQSPLDAYRSDLGRNPGLTDFGTSDTIWLLVAHCLHRLTRVPHLAREAIASHCAAALGDLASSVAPGAEDAQMVQSLNKLRISFEKILERDAADQACDVVRTMTVQMSNAGAMMLAYSTIGHLRGALTNSSPRQTGLNLAEQGRLARLLGDLDGAEELYELAEEVGVSADDAEVVVRSLLGRGVVARVRGNYPRARNFFQTGLADAKAAGFEELAGLAHTGLLIAAAVANDLDTALVHGWAAFQLADGDDARQVEMLVNLAQLALIAGYPAASLRAFVAALSRTPIPRFRLAAIGGAICAAAEVGEARLVGKLRELADETVSRSTLPYENAQTLKSVSTALAGIGDRTGAEAYRRRARQLAKAGGFFELVLATEPTPRLETTRRPKVLQEPSVRVIETLEQMEPADGELVAAIR
jgi:tetratricopeptide (TPR) repeat protein